MPFGGEDPWAVMRAAVRRTTPSGTALSTDECVSAATALTMFLGRPERPAEPRAVRPGQPGQLCLLSVPPAVALAELDAEAVAATVVGGALGYAAK
jgi:predicted amidohydrolase YtcJ